MACMVLLATSTPASVPPLLRAVAVGRRKNAGRGVAEGLGWTVSTAAVLCSGFFHRLLRDSIIPRQRGEPRARARIAYPEHCFTPTRLRVAASRALPPTRIYLMARMHVKMRSHAAVEVRSSSCVRVSCVSLCPDGFWITSSHCTCQPASAAGRPGPARPLPSLAPSQQRHTLKLPARKEPFHPPSAFPA